MKQVPTIVSNHVSIWEIVMMLTMDPIPSFLASAMVFTYPLAGFIMKMRYCLPINKSNGPEALQKMVDRIVERQRHLVSEESPMGPLCIFSEGTFTNGKNLLNFKRGAFMSKLPIKPCYVKYSYENFSPETCLMLLLPSSLMMCAEMAPRQIDLYQLPVFVPNDYLFTEYRKTLPDHEKLEDWEVYAAAVRDII